LSCGSFQFLLLADRHEGVEVLLSNVVLIASLRNVHPRLIELFSGQRSLFEELLAALKNFFLCVEGLLCLLRVGLGFPDFLGQAGSGGCGIGGLGLIVSAFGVLRRGGEIAVFKHGQQLSLMNRTAAFHQELLHRGADLGHNRCLSARKQDRMRVDGVLNRRLFNGSDLHGDDRLFIALIGGAACHD
jgi:hypothetical protein